MHIEEREKSVLTMTSYAWNRHHRWCTQSSWTNFPCWQQLRVQICQQSVLYLAKTGECFLFMCLKCKECFCIVECQILDTEMANKTGLGKDQKIGNSLDFHQTSFELRQLLLSLVKLIVKTLSYNRRSQAQSRPGVILVLIRPVPSHSIPFEKQS